MFKKSKRPRGDFGREIESHIQIEADRLVEEGRPREEAMAAARRTFGNVTNARETYYESTRWVWLERILRDIRYSLRSLKASPLSTATIIVSLALGIGFNTAIFSLADQALLRPLPVESPEELVRLAWDGPFEERNRGTVGYGHQLPHLLFRELREENDVFDDMFARASYSAHVAVGDQSAPAMVELVSGSYFPTLGVHSVVGRLLTDDDDLQPNAHPLAVLSHSYWQTRFDADASVVGETILINNYPMTVIGVAEPDFHGTDWSLPSDLWIPIMMKTRVTPSWDALDSRRERFLNVFGRLKPGVSREQAQAQLAPWFKAYIQADTEREGWGQVTEQQLSEFLASDLVLLSGAQGELLMQDEIRQPVLILMAATLLVLLLACLNVANLSLGRVLARSRSTALHAALGATRARLLTEQFVESALLAAGGCLAGVLLAPPVARAMLTLMPQSSEAGLALSSRIDSRVLLLAAGAAAVATMVSGLAPALFAASARPIDALKRQSASVTGSLGLRKALVVAQFTAALVLLIGAGLFAQTLATLRAEGAGFETSNLLMFRIEPQTTGYSGAEVKPLVRRILASVQALPDVERAAVADYNMLSSGWNNQFTIQTDRRFITNDDRSISMKFISPELFEVLHVPLVAGRRFDLRDASDDSQWNLRVAIINDEFAQKYFSDADPIGASVGIGNSPATTPNIEIVGVVGTFQDRNLREREPQIFFPLWQRGVEGASFHVRTRASSDAAAKAIRTAIHQIDPTLAVLSLRTVDGHLDNMLSNERLLASLAAAFALVATLLAVIGLYAVLSFSAARRTKEIGIRLALGAPRRSAGGLIIREAGALALIGLAIALPLCWALGRFIESQLFGVAAMDPLTITAAAAALAAVCLIASAIPARAASAVDPLKALRAE